MTDTVDCVVIGAGVVGLAVARACALQGWETVLVEAENAIGTGTSSRNSEVIHAGIYYPQGSLKARLCVQGKQRLYAYCDEKGVPYERCGKFIVATHEGQLDALRTIRAAAAANGVDDLHWLERDEAQARERALHCVAALESSSTGIVDSHGLMLALQGDFEAAGGMLAFCSPVTGGLVQAGQPILLKAGGEEPMELRAKRVINSAGLYAQQVAASIDGIAAGSIPPGRYAKGSYYSLSGASPFSRLIYPVPEEGGLGVHLTMDLGHQARFGPDVEWIDTIDYTVDPRRAAKFYEAIRSYWPALPDGALQPGYAGIRPKLAGGAQGAHGGGDFVIQDAREHGVRGLVNLYGIESPGLTASLAIADEVVARLNGEAW